MSLDAIAIRCLTGELSEKFTGGRINKVSQPERDEIVLGIRTFTDSFRLVLSASASNPRIHLTAVSKKNPATAPMFCMLLRKHIGSGKIVSIEQTGFERIINIGIESYDELGDLTLKHLVIEIMGRHSNIILTDADMKILDCIKHIDFTVSSVRQVLPGLNYEYPPLQDKTALIDFSNESALEFGAGIRADKAVMNAVSGISPIVARELIYASLRRTDIRAEELNLNQASAIKAAIVRLAADISQNKYSPCMITDIASGKILDFSAIQISQYEKAAKITGYESMNELVDAFYSTRDMKDRMRQKSADTSKLLNNLIERTAKKLVILQETLNDAENREEYKTCGDIITANIYRINHGDTCLTAENYYAEGTPVIKITLDPSLSPSQNAQRYYKKYNKLKTAQTEAAKQLAITHSELEYLESSLAALEMAETESDLNAVRAELAAQGYINRRTEDRKKRQNETSKPMHFISSDGFDIYVGRNNTQNDYLTLKLANSADIWFHTKNIHGSHTVIKLGTNKEVPPSTMRRAAELAAYYSKARESSQVPVDYTEIRNVKKPNGAKPGMVIYDSYNTVYVTPKAPSDEEKM